MLPPANALEDVASIDNVRVLVVGQLQIGATELTETGLQQVLVHHQPVNGGHLRSAIATVLLAIIAVLTHRRSTVAHFGALVNVRNGHAAEQTGLGPGRHLAQVRRRNVEHKLGRLEGGEHLANEGRVVCLRDVHLQGDVGEVRLRGDVNGHVVFLPFIEYPQGVKRKSSMSIPGISLSMPALRVISAPF
ncbi:hypothetical protein TYRP_001835 [Tyrophagus putrescentiae]|nr:hypothetical protein TYRP_001835 [Tyrophagus putrescentiae]